LSGRGGRPGADRPGRRAGGPARPPHWPAYPPGATFGALYDLDKALGLKAARLRARLIAADLIDLGITVDCLPLADVPVAGADAVIGNRAYGTEPAKVAAIARAVTEGLEQGGVPAGPEAHSRPRKGHRRQPSQAPDRRYVRGMSWNGPISPPFNRWRPADGDDRTCCV
jgi:hypothetical protein